MFSAAGASINLPFLPILPAQILLGNLLYEVGQVTIATDRVEPEDALPSQHRPDRTGSEHRRQSR